LQVASRAVSLEFASSFQNPPAPLFIGSVGFVESSVQMRNRIGQATERRLATEKVFPCTFITFLLKISKSKKKTRIHFGNARISQIINKCRTKVAKKFRTTMKLLGWSFQRLFA